MIKYFCASVFLSFPFYSFAQISAKDYEIIEKKCNKISYAIAESSYKKSVLLFETKRESADFEELYRTMIDSKCDLYKPIFFKYWTEYKDMSDYAFEKYFLNKPENYAVFLKGLYTDRYYDEIEMRDHSFVSLLKYLYSVSPKDFENYMDRVFADNGILSSGFTYIFSFLIEEKMVEQYRDRLITYALNTNGHFENIITFLYFNSQDRKPFVELLEKTQNHWSRLDNYRIKSYFTFLKNINLPFKNTNPDFNVDDEFNIKINFEKVIGDLQRKGAIGENPSIHAFTDFHPYEKGQLIPTLRKMEQENKIHFLRNATDKEIEWYKRQENISNPDGILILTL